VNNGIAAFRHVAKELVEKLEHRIVHIKRRRAERIDQCVWIEVEVTQTILLMAAFPAIASASPKMRT
jgi:hypothetical protein